MSVAVKHPVEEDLNYEILPKRSLNSLIIVFKIQVLEPEINYLVQMLLENDYRMLAVWQFCEYDTQEGTAQTLKEYSGYVHDCVRLIMKNSVSGTDVI